MSRKLRLAAALALPALALPLALSAPGTADATSSASPRAGHHQLAFTFHVKSCEGCSMALQQAVHPSDDVWTSKTKKVRDGKVTWHIDSAHVHGLSATIRAPYEGATGALSTVTFRYNGQRPGHAVSIKESKRSTKSWGCLDGDTSASRIDIDLTSHKVFVDGNQPHAAAAATFATVTQPYLGTGYRSFKGWSGTQEAVYCHQ